MTMFNKLTQVVPLLKRGIVSSVFPFAAPFPHGFTLDVMIQGGASGSPVFLEGEPTVVRMVGASLLDKGANTSISIGLPGHLLAAALKTFIENVPIKTDGVPTLTVNGSCGLRQGYADELDRIRYPVWPGCSMNVYPSALWAGGRSRKAARLPP